MKISKIFLGMIFVLLTLGVTSVNAMKKDPMPDYTPFFNTGAQQLEKLEAACKSDGVDIAVTTFLALKQNGKITDDQIAEIKAACTQEQKKYPTLLQVLNGLTVVGADSYEQENSGSCGCLGESIVACLTPCYNCLKAQPKINKSNGLTTDEDKQQENKKSNGCFACFGSCLPWLKK